MPDDSLIYHKQPRDLETEGESSAYYLVILVLISSLAFAYCAYKTTIDPCVDDEITKKK
jgi:hypothetical protein